MFTYKIKSNISYQGNAFDGVTKNRTEIKTEKKIKTYDKESIALIFETMKSDELIAEWVTVEQIWLSEGKIHFSSRNCYWQSGVIAFYTEE